MTLRNLPVNMLTNIFRRAANTQVGHWYNNRHQKLLARTALGSRASNNEIRRLENRQADAIKNLSNALRYSMRVQNDQHIRANVRIQNQMIKMLNTLVQNYPGGLTKPKFKKLTGLSNASVNYYYGPISAATRRASLRSINAAKKRARA